MRRPPPATVALLLLAASRAAHAQPSPDEIARRELLARADTARRDRDHPLALDLYSRAGALRMTPSLRQLLAYEHYALDHVLEALDEAGQCTREVTADPALPDRQRILDTCAAIVAEAQSRVGRVVITVPAAPPRGLRVRVNDRELPAALWGTAYPVLPGAVRVDADAAEAIASRQVIEVVAGATATVRLGPFVPPRHPAPPRPLPPVARSLVGPWVLAGASAVVFGAAAALALLREGARSSRDDACSDAGCRPSAQDDDARFRGYTVATDVALGVAALVALGSAAWFVLAPSRAPRAVRVGVGTFAVTF
jgi:hypothetical protein